MNKEFIPYEQALELKQLGFDEQCLAYYLADALFTSNDIVYNSTDIPIIKAPLYQQSFRWFREKHNLNCYIEHISASNQYQLHIKHYWKTFDTYEEAEIECLKKLINLVKNK
jgi:hypothetical protein